jgi:hypothetical protein
MEIEAFGIPTLKVGVTTRKLELRYRNYLKTIFFSAQLDELDAYVLEQRFIDTSAQNMTCEFTWQG